MAPHPIVRFGILLAAVALALASLVLSGMANVHSATWLVALYAVLALFVSELRRGAPTPLYRSYAIYLCALGLYIFNVWLFHLWTPRRPEEVEALREHVVFWARFVSLGSIFVPVAYFRFSLDIAKAHWWGLRLMDLAGWVLALFFYGTSLAGYFTVDARWSGTTWSPTMAGFYLYYSAFAFLYVCAGWTICVARYFRARTRQERLQLLYFIAGLIPFSLACMANFLIGCGIDLYPAGGILFLFHFGLVAYAVVRHRLYDITIIIRRSLAYAAISVGLGMSYGALVWLFGRWLPLDRTVQSLLTAILLILAAGFLYSPLLAYVQRFVDRLFFRTAVNRQQMMVGFARRVADTLDLGEVARALCDLLAQALRSRAVALYLANEQGVPVLFGEHEGFFKTAQWPESTGLPTEVEQAGWRTSAQPLRCRLRSRTEGPRVEIREGDESLVVPVVRQGETLGVLVLYPKRADEPYEDDELAFAETAAAHSAVALQNARSVARLEQLRLLTHQTLEGLTAGVFLVNHRHELIEWNQAAKTLWEALYPERDRPASISEMEAVAPSLGGMLREGVGDRRPRDNVEVRLDGARSRSLLVGIRALNAGGDRPTFLVLLHDISDYKELEAVARQREALARVGEMIAAINHEIGNILQPVQSQILRLAAHQDPGVARAVEIVQDRLSALNGMLANLKDLSRPIELRCRMLDLGNLTRSVVRDVQEMPVAADVQFNIQVQPQRLNCNADGHWLRQVLYNLIRNAAEATVGRTERKVRVNAAVTDSFVRIEIQDTGCGIDPRVRGKLFQPFFSTKGKAGTGLGLSICRRVVELHGGRIEVADQPGEGARFFVFLPLSASAQATCS